jgi:hypothetical protein
MGCSSRGLSTLPREPFIELISVRNLMTARDCDPIILIQKLDQRDLVTLLVMLD